MTGAEGAAAMLRAQVLDHLKRYRITTKDTLALGVFAGARAKSFANVMYRFDAREK